MHADLVDSVSVHQDHALLNILSAEDLRGLRPRSSSSSPLTLSTLLGSAPACELKYRCAFWHREPAYSLATIGVPVPQAGDAVIGHTEALVDTLAGWSTGGQAELRGAERPRPPGSVLSARTHCAV